MCIYIHMMYTYMCDYYESGRVAIGHLGMIIAKKRINNGAEGRCGHAAVCPSPGAASARRLDDRK